MRGPQAMPSGEAAGASEDNEESNSDSVFDSHSSGSLLSKLPTYPSSQNTSNSHPY